MDHPASDIEFLKKRYAAARNKFKPHDVKILLIAEAPPCDPDRYFYFEDVKKQHSLFLEIMAILYPEHKAAYLVSKRNAGLKHELLGEFQSDGYWLIDLSEVPHELTGEQPASNLPSLMERVKKIATKKTRIVLINPTFSTLAMLH